MGIIGEVKLMQVQSSQLKWDPTGHPLWFNGHEQDLYIVIGENEIRHFEISFGKNLISGGASKALQFGIIQSTEGIGQELSRVVDYQLETPPEILAEAKKVINGCVNLESTIKEGIIQYIDGFSFGSNPLRFKEPLNSYLPLERRELHDPKFRLHHIKKALPKHIGVKIMAGLVLAGAIFMVFSIRSSKALQFLKMDQQLNVGYVKKYIDQGGNIWVADSRSRSILHRTAQYIKSVDDDRFKAFVYLVRSQKMNPNTYDRNGYTPLYYVVKNYLNPPYTEPSALGIYKGKYIDATEAYLNNLLDVIEELLALGLNPKMRRTPKDRSVWEIGRGDPDLRDILGE